MRFAGLEEIFVEILRFLALLVDGGVFKFNLSISNVPWSLFGEVLVVRLVSPFLSPFS